MTCFEDSKVADSLWSSYARTHDPRTRDAIVMQFQRLAFSIANRFARRGVQNEDLFQVAMMWLVKAVDRFDPSTNHRFTTFATPTILGEIRRYFRDHSWNVHVPRGLQELAQQVNRVSREMTERLARQPSAAEIAAKLGLTEAAVLEALSLDETSRPLSLDGAVQSGDSDRPTVLEQCLGSEDDGIDETERRISLTQAMSHLSKSQQEIVRMRYLEELSQREVARRLGLSQMQVSRIERRALAELRAQFQVH